MGHLCKMWPLRLLGVKPGYPLMCQMILYMEQYIMTAYSGVTHDPATVPSCQQPDTKSCDSMICSWKDVWGTPTRHTYQFLRCSKPQAFRLILEVGLHVLNETYDKSRVIQVNETMQLNITVDHLSDQTFAFQVCFLIVSAFTPKGFMCMKHSFFTASFHLPQVAIWYLSLLGWHNWRFLGDLHWNSIHKVTTEYQRVPSWKT